MSLAKVRGVILTCAFGSGFGINRNCKRVRALGCKVRSRFGQVWGLLFYARILTGVQNCPFSLKNGTFRRFPKVIVALFVVFGMLSGSFVHSGTRFAAAACKVRGVVSFTMKDRHKGKACGAFRLLASHLSLASVRALPLCAFTALAFTAFLSVHSLCAYGLHSGTRFRCRLVTAFDSGFGIGTGVSLFQVFQSETGETGETE